MRLKPRAKRFRSSTPFVVGAVCLGLFTDSFTYCSIIPVLPSALVERAGVSKDEVQYYISMMMASFSLTFFIAAPILGYLSDHLQSRRQPFIWGMIANIASLLLFMVTTSPITMAFARAFQGFSSAAILVVGMALIKDTVGKGRTGEGMSYSTIAIQSGLIIGPSIGGVLYDKVGYEAVFILPVALLAIDIVLRLLIVEKPLGMKPPSSRGVSSDDVRDAAEVAEHEPLLDTSKGEDESDKPMWQRYPLLRLLTRGRMLTALLVAAIDVVQFSAMETTIPLFVMRTFDWTPTNAGLLFLATCLPGIILGYIVGRSVDRIGTLIPAVFGITVAGVCLITQRLVHENSLHDRLLLIGLWTASNISMLFVNITMSAEIGIVAQDVDDETGGHGMVAKAYALNMMACSGGQLLGPVVGGFMVQQAGWPGITLFLGTLAVSTLPLMLYFTGGGIYALFTPVTSED